MGAYDRRLRIRGQLRPDIDTEAYAAAVATMLLGLLRAQITERETSRDGDAGQEAS